MSRILVPSKCPLPESQHNSLTTQQRIDALNKKFLSMVNNKTEKIKRNDLIKFIEEKVCLINELDDF